MAHVRTYRSKVLDGVIGVELWGCDPEQLNTVTVDGEERHFVAAHATFEFDADAESVTVALNGGEPLVVPVPERRGQPPMSENRLSEPGWRPIVDPGGVDAHEVKALEQALLPPKGVAETQAFEVWTGSEWGDA